MLISEWKMMISGTTSEPRVTDLLMKIETLRGSFGKK